MLSPIYRKSGLSVARYHDKRVWLLLLVLVLLYAVISDTKVFAYEPSTQSPLSIKVAAQKFITKIIEREYPHHIIEISKIDPRMKLTACDSPLDEFLVPGSNLPGNVTIGIRCVGSKSWTIYIPASVKGMRKVVITNHPILTNTPITQNDIRLEERTISAKTNDYIFNLEHVLGKIAKHNLPASTPVTLNMLSAPTLVKRGQQVIILAEGTGVEVRMAGTALMDGTSGQIIRVINTLSKRTVEGQVIQPGIIRVNM